MNAYQTHLSIYNASYHENSPSSVQMWFQFNYGLFHERRHNSKPKNAFFFMWRALGKTIPQSLKLSFWNYIYNGFMQGKYLLWIVRRCIFFQIALWCRVHLCRGFDVTGLTVKSFKLLSCFLGPHAIRVSVRRGPPHWWLTKLCWASGETGKLLCPQRTCHDSTLSLHRLSKQGLSPYYQLSKTKTKFKFQSKTNSMALYFQHQINKCAALWQLQTLEV